MRPGYQDEQDQAAREEDRPAPLVCVWCHNGIAPDEERETITAELAYHADCYQRHVGESLFALALDQIRIDLAEALRELSEASVCQRESRRGRGRRALAAEAARLLTVAVRPIV